MVTMISIPFAAHIKNRKQSFKPVVKVLAKKVKPISESDPAAAAATSSLSAKDAKAQIKKKQSEVLIPFRFFPCLTVNHNYW